jgi:pimeloyl-ACP methyl ester carboxylesterase
MSRAGKIALTLVALAVLFLLVVAFAFWRYPVEIGMRLESRAVEKAGFTAFNTTLPDGTGEWVGYQAGNGQPLVFLHGAGDHAGAWSEVAPAFKDKNRVILLDLPGHGRSAPEEGPLPLGTILEGVTFLLDKQVAHGSRMILVGHSMGAWVAILYAREHPDRVERIVAINGGPLRGRQDVSLLPRDREEARKLMAMLRDPGSPPVPDFVLDGVVRYSRNGPIGRLVAMAADMERYLLDGKLSDFRTPVDLVSGESDRLIDFEYARRMEAQLPATRLTILPRCGHVPVRECPKGLTTALERVLSRPPPEMRAAPTATKQP